MKRGSIVDKSSNILATCCTLYARSTRTLHTLKNKDKVNSCSAISSCSVGGRAAG